MAIVAAVILALSAALCAAVTWVSLELAHKVTCEPPAPVEFRHDVLAVGLVAYVLCAVPGVVLAAIGRTTGLVFAIALACLALAAPALSLLFTLFSASLC